MALPQETVAFDISEGASLGRSGVRSLGTTPSSGETPSPWTRAGGRAGMQDDTEPHNVCCLPAYGTGGCASSVCQANWWDFRRAPPFLLLSSSAIPWAEMNLGPVLFPANITPGISSYWSQGIIHKFSGSPYPGSAGVKLTSRWGSQFRWTASCESKGVCLLTDRPFPASLLRPPPLRLFIISVCPVLSAVSTDCFLVEMFLYTDGVSLQCQS